MTKACADILIEVECSEIGTGECRRTFVLTTHERDALARNIGLVKLTSLVVEIGLKRDPGQEPVFILEGYFMASVMQECAVCLGVISVDIREDLYSQFVPEASLNVKEDIFTHSDPDHPETYSNDCLDLGKLVQDQLSLAIEPYPRHEQDSKDHQCIMIVDETNASVGLGSSPFRNLGNLLNKKKKNDEG